MSLSELLKQGGFATALIVDDAFDNVPVAADLAMDGEAWTIFMDDIRAESELVEQVFPQYVNMNANELRSSDEFVGAMWELKGRLDDGLWERLFGTYERERTSDREVLEKLKARLEAAGLQVKIAGRAIPQEARAFDMIFADLFLGAAQQDFDIEQSIKRINQLMEGRRSAPPPVVLMSRSQLLKDKKERFRDDAKMLGALFRVYQKLDLLEGSTIETTLERFATHHADAIKVAAFIEAWQSALEVAGQRFMKLIRRLDLSDYTNIRQVLLDAEGQPLGSYLLDVFDRVLQHEIEGHPPTIEAAQKLSEIDPESYPSPYIAGSPDLQDFVARTLWQHTERLKVVANTAGMPVSFGDVLLRKATLTETKPAKVAEDEPDAFVVLTPACDLIRKSGKRRVLLVGGTLKALDHKTWKYKTTGAVTPIVQLAGKRRMSITWDLDDQRMMKREELIETVNEEGPYSIAVRLRDANALELQQRMLADMGRVGLVSKMPFTFPVDVLMFTTEVDGSLRALDLPVTTTDGGVCITGRDANGDEITRLILTESSVDEILSAIPKINEEQISPRAKDASRRLKSSTSFRSLLQRGLKAPAATMKGSLIPIRVPADKAEGEQEEREEVVGLIARNPGDFEPLTTNDQKSAALIIVLNDLEPQLSLIAEVVPTSAVDPGQAEAETGAQ